MALVGAIPRNLPACLCGLHIAVGTGHEKRSRYFTVLAGIADLIQIWRPLRLLLSLPRA